MKYLFALLMIFAAGCKDAKKADLPQPPSISNEYQHYYEGNYLERMKAQDGQPRMERIGPEYGRIFEDGKKCYTWECRECIHGMPTNWVCHLCPGGQRVLPAPDKAPIAIPFELPAEQPASKADSPPPQSGCEVP